jgi:prepilin-type N-terminal cleavage/methylation domain-containing protein
MHRRGFSLIEVIMVVSLVGAIAGVGIPLYRDYQIRNDLNLATEQVTQGLARARLLSQAAQEDDNWGFYAPAGVLYKGDSYAERDPAFDETYPMPSTITIQGLMEVNYGKIAGLPDATGDITLTTINDDTRNILIEVKTESIAVVTEDRFTICHNPGPSQNTLSIPDNAWPAHQAHGDAFGACVGAASSAAVSSAAPASSAPASSAPAASSAAAVSSSTTPATCPDRVAIDADGTIRILGSLSVTFTSYGAQFGYGNGGPNVPVTVSYRKKNSGNWTNLFSGNAINGTGGASQTVTGFSTSNNSNKLFVRFKAYYSQQGWLTYENYAYSNDIPTVYMLRDGDTPPVINPGNGQAAVSTLLQPITDATGKIDVGQFDVVLLADFNRESCNSCSNYFCTNCSGVDYQDGVVLVRFNNPAC